jgi:hypothetical protein
MCCMAVSFVRGLMRLATLPLFPCDTGEAGRKYVRYMPWPQAAECNMITNKQTMCCIPSEGGGSPPLYPQLAAMVEEHTATTTS